MGHASRKGQNHRKKEGAPSCSESCRIHFCADLYRAFATRGVREVLSTARAAAVRPNGRAAWDDANDSLLASPVVLLQRMFSGFGFVGKGTMIGVLLDSPSDSRIPTHGATSVPTMPAFSGNPILLARLTTAEDAHH